MQSPDQQPKFQKTMTLKKYSESLPKDIRFKVAIKLIKLALPIWENFADKNQLKYRDTVVGLTHTVDKDILKNSIDAVEIYLNSNKIRKIIGGKSKLIEIRRQFDDPIVALQDADWELPDDVPKIFYSVYNLLDELLGKKKTAFDKSTIYVAINQAIDALDTSETLTVGEINKILDDVRNAR